jgi:flagellin
MAFGDLTRVGANFHALEALFSLKRINGQMGVHQSALATGKRINSAQDDTAGYSIARSLESRGRGLSQALDNVSTAKNVLNIAEGGFQAQMSILQTIKEKATQASDGSWDSTQREAINDQVSALLSEVDDIAGQTKFNGYTLMSNSFTYQVGEESSDQLTVDIDSSTSSAIGESDTDLSGISLSTQASASAAIDTLTTAIDSLAASIQSMGDFQARISSKEESLSVAITNTEATRSRIEDADFAKEQMEMIKLQILQQTSVSSFVQANSAPQMVLSLFGR